MPYGSKRSRMWLKLWLGICRHWQKPTESHNEIKKKTVQKLPLLTSLVNMNIEITSALDKALDEKDLTFQKSSDEWMDGWMDGI